MIPVKAPGRALTGKEMKNMSDEIIKSHDERPRNDLMDIIQKQQVQNYHSKESQKRRLDKQVNRYSTNFANKKTS